MRTPLLLLIVPILACGPAASTKADSEGGVAGSGSSATTEGDAASSDGSASTGAATEVTYRAYIISVPTPTGTNGGLDKLVDRQYCVRVLLWSGVSGGPPPDLFPGVAIDGEWLIRDIVVNGPTDDCNLDYLDDSQESSSASSAEGVIRWTGDDPCSVDADLSLTFPDNPLWPISERIEFDQLPVDAPALCGPE